jgi:hypothetical protein
MPLQGFKKVVLIGDGGGGKVCVPSPGSQPFVILFAARLA